MEILDIYSRGDYPADILSNFAPNRFVFDGVECACMEGFLQSLKFKNAETQLYVCGLIGKTAKATGARKRLWKITGNVYWQGKRYKRKSEAFDALIKRAYQALYLNEAFRTALESTQGIALRHSIGGHKKNKTILTEQEFIENLYALRDNK